MEKKIRLTRKEIIKSLWSQGLRGQDLRQAVKEYEDKARRPNRDKALSEALTRLQEDYNRQLNKMISPIFKKNIKVWNDINSYAATRMIY